MPTGTSTMPEAVDTYTAKTDGVDDALAVDFNRVQDALKGTSGIVVGPMVYNMKNPAFAGGAKGDCKIIVDGAITASSAVLTSPSNPFVPADAGKLVWIAGAGAGGGYFAGTIQSYTNAGSVTLATLAVTTVSGATVTYGTDDTAVLTALKTLIEALPAAQGARILAPPSVGAYLFSNITINHDNVTIEGEQAVFISSYANDNVTNAIQLFGNNVACRGWTGRAITMLTPTQRAAGGNLSNGDFLRIGGPSGTFKDRSMVENVYIYGAYAGGIVGFFANRIAVRFCRAENCDGNGINIDDCQNDVVVMGNVATNCGDDLIVVVTDSNVPAGTIRVVIVGNIATGGDAKGIGVAGGGDWVLIADNVVDYTYTFALYAFIDSVFNLGLTNHIQIVNNVVRRAGQRFGGSFLHGGVSTVPHGIFIGAGVLNPKVQNNLLYDTNGRGIQCDGATNITTTTSGITFPVATIPVVNSYLWPGASIRPALQIIDANGNMSEFNYGGTAAGISFTGVTGGAGTFPSGSSIVAPTVGMIISGNIIRLAGQSAISVGNPDATNYLGIADCQVVNNNIRNVKGGIIMGATTGFVIAANIIRSYTLASGGAYRGIQMGRLRNGQVYGNVVINDDGGGAGSTIFLYNGPNPNVRRWGNLRIEDPTLGDLGDVFEITNLLFSSVGGGRMSMGSGPPNLPVGVNPVAGDVYFRTDTPTVGNQRIYMCSVGGANPTWVGLI